MPYGQVSFMTPDLARRVVVLTGGGDGIGRECGLAYARAGATVDTLDWNMAAAERTTTELGVESFASQAVVSDAPQSLPQ